MIRYYAGFIDLMLSALRSHALFLLFRIGRWCSNAAMKGLKAEIARCERDA